MPDQNNNNAYNEPGYGASSESDFADGYGSAQSQPYGSGDNYWQTNYISDPNSFMPKENEYLGNNPWQTDYISDGYRENVFEVNFLDTAYTETLSNPNPQAGYISQYSDSEDLEL